jgi:superoxide dismutase, Fe-Mn family
MKKRTFLKTSGILALGTMLAPLQACSDDKKKPTPTDTTTSTANVFELPELGFDFAALEPHIDAKTMEIHHTKHHAGYTKKFNKALNGHALAGKDLQSILSNINAEDTALRNNAGGYYNHKLFWEVIRPNGAQTPQNEVSKAIDSSFGSFENFSNTFKDAAKTVFGSGWAWLIIDKSGKLAVTSTPNQDNPLMANISTTQGQPILGIDVWEHAYYLNYQNRRADYINAFFNVINWDQVAKNFDASTKKG